MVRGRKSFTSKINVLLIWMKPWLELGLLLFWPKHFLPWRDGTKERWVASGRPGGASKKNKWRRCKRPWPTAYKTSKKKSYGLGSNSPSLLLSGSLFSLHLLCLLFISFLCHFPSANLIVLSPFISNTFCSFNTHLSTTFTFIRSPRLESAPLNKLTTELKRKYVLDCEKH